MWKSTLVFVAVVSFSEAALACTVDPDCGPGSRCEDGRCVDGVSPGNWNDRSPRYDPADLNGTSGDACRLDTECGAGSECANGACKPR